jgi:hypothetical protein
MVFEHFIRQNYSDLDIDYIGRDFPISINSARSESEFMREDKDIILTGWLTQNPTRFLSFQRNLLGLIGIHLATEGSLAFKDFGIKYMFLSETFRNEFAGHMVSCRDLTTKDFLASKGVNAPFVGCVSSLISHLDLSFIPEQPSTDFLFADIDSKIRDKILANGLPGKKFTSLTNDVSEFLGEREKERRVEKLIGEIISAEVVVTSRLHVALPSVALGKPTLLISNKDPRLAGISNFLNIVSTEEALIELSKEEILDFAFKAPNVEIGEMSGMVTTQIRQILQIPTLEKIKVRELDYASQVLSEVASALIQQLEDSQAAEKLIEIELEAVLSTRSWKLTTPLRKISQLQKVLRQ